jgi:hypothetical protein
MTALMVSWIAMAIVMLAGLVHALRREWEKAANPGSLEFFSPHRNFCFSIKQPRAVLSGRSLQTQLFYPGDQSGGLKPQKLRGSIDALDFPAGPPQDDKKILALAASHFWFG